MNREVLESIIEIRRVVIDENAESCKVHYICSISQLQLQIFIVSLRSLIGGYNY